MGKIKRKVEPYEVQEFIRSSMVIHRNRAMPQAEATDKKPWGIQSNDWYRSYGKFPWGDYFKYAIPEWRNFRYYKSKSARDRALIDLTKQYRYTCTFRVPPTEDRRAFYTEKRIKETESIFCSYLKKIFGDKK